jgi:histone H2A
MPRGRPADPKVAARKAAEAERIANLTEEQIVEEKTKTQQEREAKAATKSANNARFKKMVTEMHEKNANMPEEERKQFKALQSEKNKKTRKRLQGDLIFPVHKMKHNLRGYMGLRKVKKKGEKEHTRITLEAAIFSAAVIEYLTAEVLELSGECTKQMKKGRIVPRHILSAVRMDDELSELFPKSTTISSAGVMPTAIPAFLTRNNVSRKEFNMSASVMFKPTAVSASSVNHSKKKKSVQKSESSVEINNNK